MLRKSGKKPSAFGAKIGSLFERAFSGEPDGLNSEPVARDYRHSLAVIKKARETNAVAKLVEFSFSCEGLPKMDLLSDSDPFLVVMLADGVKKEVELLRTETVWDEMSPRFVHALLLLEPTSSMTLRIVAYDRDRESEKLDKHDFLGETKVLASDVVAAGSLTAPLFNRKGENKNDASVTVTACTQPNVDDLDYSLEFCLMLASSADLTKLDSGPTRIFFVISRLNKDLSSWASVFRSEVLSGSLSSAAHFRVVPLSVGACCPGGDLATKLRFELFLYRALGSHESCGAFVTSVKELEHLSTASGVSREFLGSDDDMLSRVELTGGFLSDEKMSFVFDIHLRKL